ncbi:MAG: 4-hydroxythreonine-4-phosphate dehydrogenase PdxA [Candidatus Wallbacteria bacterium]|nr:4-hydroxythreonine-4-phosphate dehydrogenase PdxA [Candidatus Wallbacteria bacterium]
MKDRRVDGFRRPLIAITMGDPAGVGPEIVARAAAAARLRAACVPLVCGDPEVMRRAVELTGRRLTVREVAGPAETIDSPRTLCVVRGSHVSIVGFAPGKPQAACGEAAFRFVVDAVALARAGKVSAIVTAPISKEALWMAGHRYPGHTEILAELTRTRRFALMLADGPRRVVHVTCHQPLAEAVGGVTRRRVLETLRLGNEAVRRLARRPPRIAVCGLNPHAGEAGLFGDEERRRILPAIRDALREGVRAVGPIPADTAFVRAFSGEFDLTVAMYHDQGHIPFKLACFQAASGRMRTLRGVNVTLGLPIVRTSVDHGTAWDLAWKGEALPDSLLDAVEMAVALSVS